MGDVTNLGWIHLGVDMLIKIKIKGFALHSNHLVKKWNRLKTPLFHNDVNHNIPYGITEKNTQ